MDSILRRFAGEGSCHFPTISGAFLPYFLPDDVRIRPWIERCVAILLVDPHNPIHKTSSFCISQNIPFPLIK